MKIKRLIAVLAVVIVLPLLFTTGCQKKSSVTYGYTLVCLNCQTVLKKEQKTRVVLAKNSDRWKVEKINVPCQKDKACNDKKRCRKCQYQECTGRKVPLQVARYTESKKLLKPTVVAPPEETAPPPSPAPAAPPAPAPAAVPSGAIIRVGIHQPADNSVSFMASGPYQILEGNTPIAEGRPGELVNIRFGAGHYTLSAHVSKETPSYLRFVPTGDTIFDVTTMSKNNQYKGALEVRFNATSHKLWLINEVPIENYLKGIGEEPERWAGVPAAQYQEFLKAAVVAFRSYVLAVKEEGKRNKNEAFDILATASDQVYMGYKRELHGNNLKRAVEDTRGEVVTYQGRVAKAAYFGSCDGMTRPGGKPWLMSVSSPFCVGKELRGHGWGMCMHGARHLAATGKTYRDILAYYYLNTTVDVR